MMPRFATAEDAALITSICTHPDVKKWTAQDGAEDFDVTPWLHPSHMVVLVENGAFLANWLGDLTFGVHTNFLPEARGKAAVLSADMALMLAFVRSNAETFVTKVPKNNRAAAWFTNAMGFRPTYSQPKAWLSGGVLWDVDHYRLDIDDWIVRGTLVEMGHEFHIAVEAAGIDVTHEEDFIHDCYVGAAYAMVQAGKVSKGIRIYNRWAMEAGYQPLRWLSRDPICIDARDFIIHVEGGVLRIEPKGELECLQSAH